MLLVPLHSLLLPRLPLVDRMEDDATGHRYGNFPNYYSFNPPENRINVLKRSGILDRIIHGLTDECVQHEEGTDDGGQRKKPRLDVNSMDKLADNCADGGSNETKVVNYCDLGCNAGDLTMAMATVLAGNESRDDKKVNSKQLIIKCAGIDIDSKLIDRANSKYSSGSAESVVIDDQDSKGPSHSKHIIASFKTANLCNALEHNSTAAYFSESIRSEDMNNMNITPRQIFDLTTIFSTTMWIHVHAGDEGLKDFLERACGWTKTFLLIEPQPSGWYVSMLDYFFASDVMFTYLVGDFIYNSYRKANTRLRKLGLSELEDVSSARLKLRPTIEDEIDKFILGQGFRRVRAEPLTSETDKEIETTTAWKRTLHLYERNPPSK